MSSACEDREAHERELLEKDVEAIGEHCDISSCHRLDFLPFKCESCKGCILSPHRPALLTTAGPTALIIAPRQPIYAPKKVYGQRSAAQSRLLPVPLPPPPPAQRRHSACALGRVPKTAARQSSTERVTLASSVQRVARRSASRTGWRMHTLARDHRQPLPRLPRRSAHALRSTGSKRGRRARAKPLLHGHRSG